MGRACGETAKKNRTSPNHISAQKKEGSPKPGAGMLFVGKPSIVWVVLRGLVRVLRTPRRVSSAQLRGPFVSRVSSVVFGLGGNTTYGSQSEL